MGARRGWTFLALILAQGAHSGEEYVLRLYDHLPPARAVSESLGFDRAAGFVVVNSLLFGFGLLCWLLWVRPGRRPAWAVAFAWAILETLNALGHFALAYAAGGYFPGLYTAPLLLLVGLLLLAQLVRRPANPSRAAP
ncbi:MAG TPA: HXXEE domain-containing protein [Allosphingosinicella sp.]|nr:HXXEE domain-containing protein [Allosphingosinicella sp.]